MNVTQVFSAIGFLLIATTLEVSGDALARIAIYDRAGLLRIVLMLAAAVLLLGYGFALNLAPVEFRHVVGLYIATLFGGALIVAGGLIVTFARGGEPV
jgi:uncharacterized membrane protein